MSPELPVPGITPSPELPLANTIDALFQKTLEKAELNKLVQELCKRGHVLIENDKVSYGSAISSS